MDKKLFKKITEDIKALIIKDAKKYGWMWFYDVHQKEVVNAAEKLLKLYKADREVVIIACWLHDISKYKAPKDKKSFNKIHANHHIDSADFARKFLKRYKLEEELIERIAECVLRHRNSTPYEARTKEEKIVAVADTLSHFMSVFYFTYFKFYPHDEMMDMAKSQIKKMQRDWRDLNLLPKSKSIVKNEYNMLMKLHENYLKK